VLFAVEDYFSVHIAYNKRDIFQRFFRADQYPVILPGIKSKRALHFATFF
jgi:hypothetical protein